ncbi:type 2 lantibiotic biosynthesis protein LanM [Tahibacter aquaticus]|uniref:Type 2 lantibiotic biosynthesis protein LanM n=1 Tax=Tahibacter aquaticus TaxID=520092 RepID=A0A4R6YSU1_9GAMM|nr:type 2 lanthipeptide synthetase LanM family protein [Tahibacter aquaticus]TDR41273.1 type 2 lantibiotic biosynthesis protein LanM [Tahibacter aquaticus]
MPTLASSAPAATFADIVDRHTRSSREALAADLVQLAPMLDAAEIALIAHAADAALTESARLKLNRVLLLELHAAQRAGELDAPDEAARFARFVSQAQTESFDRHLQQRYPALWPRLQQSLRQQRLALREMAARLVADRAVLATLLGQPAGRLSAINLGMGDLHAGGHAVAQLQFEGGRLLYKPRSLRIDQCLDTLLQNLFGDDPLRIRVPAVVDRSDYGWAAFVMHRHCANEAELQRFYRGLGEWLGVLRLIGGVDIHHENLIACGPVPVVVDPESLFALVASAPPSGNGHAYDLASNLAFTSVVRTGIVPFRSETPGFSGVDLSAAGSLPGQQPKVHAPVIADEGTTRAHLKLVDVDVQHAQNHPCPQPDVSRFWNELSEGFLAVSTALRTLDARGGLAPLLDSFRGCMARDVRRPTQAYVEIARMLWHPASLHDAPAARIRARELLRRNAALTLATPVQDDEIEAEIDALCSGDIPVFAAPLAAERIGASLNDWRHMRTDLEELTVRCALVATNLNRTGGENERDGRHFFARQPHTTRLETRRRILAADAVERLLRLAVRGNDGSVTWITPETSRGNWLVQPVRQDLYFGLGGVLVGLAGYRREVLGGRADPVAGIDESLAGALQVLRALDASTPSQQTGGYDGLGARIWIWLTLSDLLQQPGLLDHAIAAAAQLEQIGFAGDNNLDIIDGCSGAIVPLLQLAEATADARWLAVAAQAGRHLEARAVIDAEGARWLTPVFPEPVGGFAHGAAGIAWALARLALSGAGDAADRARWQALSEQGFAFQSGLYEEDLNNWLDKRQRDAQTTFHTWCNGSVGIGMAAADLYARTGHADHLLTLRRAVRASQGMWGISHTLCHGDMSLCELFLRAARLDPEHCAVDPQEPVAQVVSSIEENRGFIGSMTRAAFTPGLMTGLSGAIHGLNRLHADCAVPSPLLFERRVG